MNDKGDGMCSVIENNIPNELMSFRHLGEVRNGIEQKMDKISNFWEGSLEIYKLTGTDKETELDIEIDVPELFENFMKEAFTQGILTIKEIAEE